MAAARGFLSYTALRWGGVAVCVAAALLALGAEGALAQQAQPTAVAAVGSRPVEVIRTPMSLSAILMIAAVAAVAAAINGLVGAIFLFIIWMWLYGGVLPSIWLYLREPASHPWAPHLLLPLIVFLLVWQYRFRGKIGPSRGLRQLIQDLTTSRSRRSFAPSALGGDGGGSVAAAG